MNENFNFPNLTIEEAAVGINNGEITFNIDTESSINSIKTKLFYFTMQRRYNDKIILLYYAMPL